MKPFLLTLLLLTGLSSLAETTQPNDVTISNISRGEYLEKWFQIRGDKSAGFLNEMFNRFPKTKRKGYIHKFTNIKVPGVDGILDLQIHEGVHRFEPNQPMAFNTFVSEKYKVERMGRMDEYDVLGLIIYVKKNKKEVIQTDQEAQQFVQFIHDCIAAEK